MTKIEQKECFQTRIHTFSLLMPIGDFHHRTWYIMYGTRFKSHKNSCSEPYSITEPVWRKLFRPPQERILRSSCSVTDNCDGTPDGTCADNALELDWALWGHLRCGYCPLVAVVPGHLSVCRSGWFCCILWRKNRTWVCWRAGPNPLGASDPSEAQEQRASCCNPNHSSTQGKKTKIRWKAWVVCCKSNNVAHLENCLGRVRFMSVTHGKASRGVCPTYWPEFNPRFGFRAFLFKGYHGIRVSCRMEEKSKSKLKSWGLQGKKPLDVLLTCDLWPLAQVRVHSLSPTSTSEIPPNSKLFAGYELVRADLYVVFEGCPKMFPFICQAGSNWWRRAQERTSPMDFFSKERGRASRRVLPIETLFAELNETNTWRHENRKAAGWILSCSLFHTLCVCVACFCILMSLTGNWDTGQRQMTCTKSDRVNHASLSKSPLFTSCVVKKVW